MREARMAGRMARWLALAALVPGLTLAGCGARSIAGPGAPRAAQATATPTGLLPAFADWRIAGLGAASALHVYTLDGKSDLTGPTLDVRAHNLTVSPNGRTIAFLTAPKYGPITLVELGATTLAQSTITVSLITGDLSPTDWSPDGSRLIVWGTQNGQSGTYLVDALTGKTTAVAFLGSGQPFVEWADATHIVISGGRETLLLDVDDGTFNRITLPDSLSITHISSDGRQALLVAGCGSCCSFTPDVALYTFATGAIRHLPNITYATDGEGPALWQPGTSLAVGLLHPQQRNSMTATTAALFDLASDTVTPLQPNLVPRAWLPDGQTLLLASLLADGSNGAFYMENPVAPTTQPAPLPANIGSVLGFVRTAGGPATGSAAPVAPLAGLAQPGAAAAHHASAVALLDAHPLAPALPRCG
ncbi:MAG TPA: hypothetical protein VGR57_03225 [Ktedonobacterales bacterium]|nr:hypothetical protein [Ktedonobacterales bacterium]